MIHVSAAPPRWGPGLADVRSVAAVVNAASGSVGPAAAASLEAILRDYGLTPHVANVPPRRIARAVRAALERRPDLLVILAGDGTANLAARLAGPDGPLIAPLPGGTMNLLPHALYGARSWREALDLALTQGSDRMISGGEIGGRSFFVAAIVGAPALWADVREALRARRFALALARAKRALAHVFTRELRYSLGDGPLETAEALMLLCPVISLALDDGAVLEAAVLDPRDAAQLLRLGFAAATGRWRTDPCVVTRACDRGRVVGGRPLRALLDGEPHRLEAQAAFRFTPRAFRALAPPSGRASGAQEVCAAAEGPLAAGSS